MTLNSTWVSGTPLVFVATSGTFRLEFQHTVGSSSANLALDDVQVIPEPATFAILAGAGTLYLLRRRRA